MERPRAAVVGVMLAGLVAAVGCAGRGHDRTLNVIWQNELPSLDPNQTFDFVADTIAMNVFEPLVRYDRQMAFAPCLAKAWEVREGSVWRFRLREGVLFQDGSPFSAEDVVFSIRRLQDHPDREIHRYVSAIREVRVVDPLTVDISSERPAGLLSVLSFVYILPRKSFERVGAEAFLRAPAGTGPYRIAEWRKGESLRLEAHERYWGGPPKIPVVVFRLVKDDDAMWTEARRLAPAVVFSPSTTAWVRHAKDGWFQHVERPGLAVHFLAMRLTGGPQNPLADVRVRRALRAAIDYKSLLSGLPAEGAFPASQFVPPAIVGFDPELSVPAFVPGSARRLLAEAGFRQAVPLVFLTARGGGPFSRKLIQALRGAGVEIREESVPQDEFDRRSAACDADLFLSGWICSTGDAGELFEGNFYRKGSTAQTCGYGDDDMDAAIEEIGRTLDPALRRDLLQKAMRRLVDDLPWIPLIVSYERHALTPGVEWQTRADGQLDLRDLRIR